MTDIQDLLALGGTHPTEQGLPAKEKEDSIRHAGTLWLIAGTGFLAAAIVGTLVLAVVNPTVLASPAGNLLLHLAGMLIAAVGGALIAAAMIERTQRGTRTLIRAAMARAKTNGDTADRTRELVNQLVDAANRTEAQISALTDVVQALAAHLPDALQGENWKGFTAAIKRGFDATGTAGPEHHRRHHLNVVPPQDLPGPLS